MPSRYLQAVGAHAHDALMPGGEGGEEAGLIEGQEIGDGAVPAAGGGGCCTRLSGWIRRRLSPQRAMAERDFCHLTTFGG